MIKAQDLRIGNVFRGIGGVQTVLSLEENTDRGKCNYSNEEHRLMYSHLILCHQNGNQYKPFEIEPIPLTEEILLKVGFVRTKVPMKSDIEYIDYRMGQFVLFILPKGIVEVEFCAAHNKIEERGYLRAVKYLHQLQNLYFALTARELDISKIC